MFSIKKLETQGGLTWVDDTSKPVILPSEVLVAPRYAGICGTDRHIYEWDDWAANRVPLGITTGHEFMGVVAEVGSGVTSIEVGQRVSVEGHVGCGSCQACRTGQSHICNKVEILGIDRDGCFASYVAVPAGNVWPLPSAVDDVTGAILDPLGNAVHTVMAANVSGKSVLITGVGVIGLMAVAVARAAGASKIIVTDVDQAHMDKAIELGADVQIHARDDGFVAKVRELTNGLGPQVLLEMSGAESAVNQGMASLRNGGTAALLGVPHRPLEMNIASDVIFKGATVLGINGRLMYETWYQVESFLERGIAEVSSLVTHVFDVADYEKAFETLLRGNAIKILLKFPDQQR